MEDICAFHWVGKTLMVAVRLIWLVPHMDHSEAVSRASDGRTWVGADGRAWEGSCFSLDAYLWYLDEPRNNRLAPHGNRLARVKMSARWRRIACGLRASSEIEVNVNVDILLACFCSANFTPR